MPKVGWKILVRCVARDLKWPREFLRDRRRWDETLVVLYLWRGELSVVFFGICVLLPVHWESLPAVDDRSTGEWIVVGAGRGGRSRAAGGVCCAAFRDGSAWVQR